MKILVVDDEEMMLKAIEFQLEKDDHEIVTAFDGKDALKIIRKEKFDLIISDIAMPNFSGLELLDHLKEGLLDETPVILISALNQKSIISTALELGANDFIVKPINMDELSIRVKGFAPDKKAN